MLLNVLKLVYNASTLFHHGCVCTWIYNVCTMSWYLLSNLRKFIDEAKDYLAANFVHSGYELLQNVSSSLNCTLNPPQHLSVITSLLLCVHVFMIS